MARPVWSGTISFGMVSIPVKLQPAVRRRTVSFNQLDADTMSRIRYRKVSDSTGEEVPAERIVRAVNVGGEQYVIVSDDELAALSPERSKEIVIDAFVPAVDIDPVSYDSSFHITPDVNAKPYALLAAALEGTGRVGIGRFVMRQKEHLAAIRSDGRRLQLSTMVFADELIAADDVEEFDVLDEVELSDRELDMAGSLVEAMTAEFDPTAYVDEYRVAVDALIEQKASGAEPLAVAPSEERGTVIDLAEALERSLAQAQSAKGRHPSSRDDESSTDSAPSKGSSSGSKGRTKKAAGTKSSSKATAPKKAPAKKVARARKSA